MPCPPSYEELELPRQAQQYAELRALTDQMWPLLVPSAALIRAFLERRPEMTSVVRALERALVDAEDLGKMTAAEARWKEPPASSEQSKSEGWDALNEELRRLQFQTTRLEPLVRRAELALCILGSVAACWQRDVPEVVLGSPYDEPLRALLTHHAEHRESELKRALAAATPEQRVRLEAIDRSTLLCDRDCIWR